MNGDEPPRSRMGLSGKARELSDLDELNPERTPSRSGYWVEERPGGTFVLVMQVKWLGAIVMRGEENAEGVLKDDGVSIFTAEEIRWDKAEAPPRAAPAESGRPDANPPK